MGLFRGAKTGVGDLERELDQLRTRRKALLSQQQTAAAALQRAREDRRTRLLESDDLDAAGADREKVKGLVLRLADELDAVADALATVDAKLAEAEGKLAAERDRAKRDAEAGRCRTELDTVRTELSELRAKFATMADAMRAVDRVPAMLAARENLERLGAQLLVGIGLGLADGESYIQQMLAEHAPIRVEPVAPVVPAPQPTVERKAVFLRHAGRWREADGEVITAGKHCTVSPPIAIALAAIEHGHAVDPESRVAQELRRLQDPDFAWQPPGSCRDISIAEPAEVMHATEPLRHTGLPGGRTGTAVATPVR
jgi:hypothetical protein